MSIPQQNCFHGSFTVKLRKEQSGRNYSLFSMLYAKDIQIDEINSDENKFFSQDKLFNSLLMKKVPKPRPSDLKLPDDHLKSRLYLQRKEV